MQRYFNPALEAEAAQQDDEDVTLAESRDFEEQLVGVEEAQALEFNDDETVGAVMESLGALAMEAHALSLEPSAASATTLSLLQMGANQQLARLGLKLKTVSLESYEPQVICQRHFVAAESIKDIVNHIGTQYVVNYKIEWDFFNDLFKSTEAMVGKYETRLAEARHEWEQRDKDTFKATQVSPLVGVWQFFSRDARVVLDPPNEIVKDAEATKFILVDYPKAVLGQLQKLTSILSQHANVTRVEDVAAVANAVHGLKAPASLFEQHILGGSYLNSTKLELVRGSNRSPIELGGRSYPELAKLATSAYVRESKNAVHAFQEMVRHVPLMKSGATLVDLLLLWGSKVKTNDIVKLYDGGDAYLAHIRSFMGQQHALQQGIQAFNSASEKFAQSVDAAKIPGAKAVVSQINQLGKNFERCLESPAAAEISRALKGARFAAYLGRRLTFGAH